MLISKLAEPLYNLRSKGKMTATDNPTGNALVVADNPGGSRGMGETRNDQHVAQMENEMESLSEEVRQIREFA